MKPSGVRASSGYPFENGYGHEEWNNSRQLRFEENGISYRAFHTERVGDVASLDKVDAIFLYASHGGVQELVGAAADAKCLIEDINARNDLTDQLKIDTLWTDAWALTSVKQAYHADREKFLNHWRQNSNWIPNWRCAEEMYFQPSSPVKIDAMQTRGTNKLLTMFSRYTEVEPQTLLTILGSVPIDIRDNQWRNVYSQLSVKVGRNDTLEIDIDEMENDQSITPTSKKALIDARRGQGRFRVEVGKIWKDACAVTGHSLPALLRASHIKPWCSCSNMERLDPENGLLLVANIDALFDRYLVTFDNDGSMIVAQSINTVERSKLAIPENLKLRLTKRQRTYMSIHRHEFLKRQICN